MDCGSTPIEAFAEHLPLTPSETEGGKSLPPLVGEGWGEVSGKRVAVIGMARTGIAAAEALVGLGATVVVYDSKPASELGDAVDAVKAAGAQACPGVGEPDLAGFDILVPSPGVPRSSPVLASAVAGGIEVMSEIELAWRISKAPIIAITGTNGKTTTTVLTGKMLMADARDTYIAGNVAGGEFRMPLVKAAAAASEDSVIVAEISTFQLEWVKAFRPRIAALLNVTSDHLDRHASWQEYADLKARIFANQTSDDYAVVNLENEFTATLAPRLSGHVLQFARKSEPDEGAFVRGDWIAVRIDGVETAICRTKDVPLRGTHNLENVLAACCMSMAFGARPDSIARAIREFRPVEHRLEPVAVIDGVEYVNNSMCTNVDAAVRSIEAISEPQIVIMGGKDKGSDFTAVGQAIAQRVKRLVLIGADAALIRDSARQCGFDRITMANSMADAVNEARDAAEPGDVVVLTPGCASFDMFSSFEERGKVFKDAVRALANRSGRDE